ncbi:MAG: N-acetylmuramidase domain-containing protein [Variovorax sp.]
MATATKAGFKRAATKRASAKKAPAKKAAKKKTAAQRTPTKKTPAKKSATKKRTAPKPASKPATEKKRAPKKASITPRAKSAPTKKTARARPKVTTPVATPAKKIATAKHAKSTPARKPRAPWATRQFYDPRSQLDKLSQEPSPAAISRGMSDTVETPAPRLPDEFFAAHTDATISDQAFADAAQDLGCEEAAVRAVAEVESHGSGFDRQGRPTILYERHVFSRCTQPRNRFDAEFPDISFNKPYAPGTFGNGEQQYIKIGRAYQLDPVAALKAPSWGMFQILGENHKACGFDDVKSYAHAMCASQTEHLKAFVAFVQSNSRMLQALRTRDWATFARNYNGPGYATYQYDKKIEAAYGRHANPM